MAREVYVTIVIHKRGSTLVMGFKLRSKKCCVFLLAIASCQIQTRWDLCDSHRMASGLLSYPSLLSALKLCKPKVLLLVDIALALTYTTSSDPKRVLQASMYH